MSHFLNQIEMPVRWADIDAYQHVGNQHYFQYMMEARAQFLQKHMGKGIADYLFILVDTRCNYKKSFYYGETVLVRQFLLNLGNSSFELQYLLSTPEEPDIIRAEGYAKMVCVDAKTQRAVRVPETVRQTLLANTMQA
ncbi:MAG: thioesterase [Gammaproteobacteria bacterium]|jgi:acyl-CoA thioester hydrolase|nr:thioesterase [Gammaproteobacteria bacterium]